MPFYARFWLFGLLALAACATPLPPSAPPATETATETARHYRAFESAEALAAYLRYENESGPRYSAHRGGHGPRNPENAIETFGAALRAAPALIETDVRLTRDSVLVLLHDETLDRTTTGTGRLDAVSLAEVRTLRLRDDKGRVTKARLPTLAEALAWAEDRAVYTLDVKNDVPPAILVRAVRQAQAENRVVIITYTPDALAAFLRLAPDLNYSIPASSTAELDAVLAVPGVNPDRLIGFVGVGVVPEDVVVRLHALNIRAMVGVFGAEEAAVRQGDGGRLAQFRALDADVIATGAVSEAAQLEEQAESTRVR